MNNATSKETERNNEAAYLPDAEGLVEVFAERREDIIKRAQQWMSLDVAEDAFSYLVLKVLGQRVNGRELRFEDDSLSARTTDGWIQFALWQMRGRASKIWANRERWQMPNDEAIANARAYRRGENADETEKEHGERIRLERIERFVAEEEYRQRCADERVNEMMDKSQIINTVRNAYNEVCNAHRVNKLNREACRQIMLDGVEMDAAVDNVWGAVAPVERKRIKNTLSQAQHRIVGYMRDELRNNAVVLEYLAA